jgi:hypothetical protein
MAFLDRNARFMVTFAEVALEGMRVPYMSSAISRLKNWGPYYNPVHGQA